MGKLARRQTIGMGHRAWDHTAWKLSCRGFQGMMSPNISKITQAIPGPYGHRAMDYRDWAMSHRAAQHP
eukprot:7203446-Karenia_brevis.AAC.1